MGLIDSIIGAESGGNPNATNPNSSASGPGQFIDSTFLDVIRKARPDLAAKPDSELLALKTDPVIGRQATEAYAAQNGAILSQNGLPVTPGTTYLAHFAGPQGAISVLNADPTAPVSSVMSPGAMKANPFLQNMTVADLRAWADRKMGGGQPAQASPAAAPNAMPPSSPMPQASRVASALMGQPQAAPAPMPRTAGDVAGQLMGTAPDQGMQMQPIAMAQRHAVDLSKLRAAFKPQTFFGRG